MNIILIGMPNSGKSTVGAVLSHQLGKAFIDCDELITSKEGRFPAAIVAEDGLKYFLDVQEKTVCGLQASNSIIATGGSMVYSDCAMKHLKATGIVIFLKLDLSTVEDRFQSGRKLARSEGQTLADLYRERLPLYTVYADLIVDVSGRNAVDIAAEIILRGGIRE